MTGLGAATRTNLIKQGFGTLDDAAKARYASPLRFTPAVATTLIVIGLALQSPVWLGAMAVVALTGAALPKGMLLDLVYNLGVRHLFHAAPLPATPKPRQFSYLLSAVLLAGSALSFYYGLTVPGLILGGVVVIGSTILTLRLWCLGSWFYSLIFGRSVTDWRSGGRDAGRKSRSGMSRSGKIGVAWRIVNISIVERAGRIALGLAAVAAGTVLLVSATSGLAVVLEVALLLAGLDMIVTGATGHCPWYQRLGRVPRGKRSTS